MEKFFLIIIVILIIISSCKGEERNLNNEGKTITLNEDTTINCFNSEFYKCIDSYIQRTKIFFFVDEPVYYSIYFFTKDDVDYFTIWTNYTPPDELMSFDSSFKYSSIKINKNDVIIITKDTYNNEQLYQCCDSLIKRDSIPKHDDTSVIYDGRWYIETYSYLLYKGKYVLNKKEVPIVDIFGDIPEMFW